MGELSQTRFTAGKTDYLEVLTNETNTFTAELNLAQARGNELLALVQLYQALGGGWQQCVLPSERSADLWITRHYLLSPTMQMILKFYGSLCAMPRCVDRRRSSCTDIIVIVGLA